MEQKMAMLSEQAMRDAVAARDSACDGQFLYGVITTGVFCRPSCNSRPAKPENLRFFADLQAAMAAGFRPCQRCQPVTETPRIAQLIAIAHHIEAHAEQKLTLASLANLAGLSPTRLQRLFKQAFGVSPRAWQDAVRMRQFKHALKQGDGVTDAIFSAGFGSISRVYGEASRNGGMSPRAYRAGGAGERISYACRNTALGLMLMAATDRGVCFVQFADDGAGDAMDSEDAAAEDREAEDGEAALVSALRAEFPHASLTASPATESPALDAWVEALDRHISQNAPRPELPLDMRGTAFQIKVWQCLLSIREGDTLSYSQLAAKAGQPKAARAVASACARNRIGVLIPCHRVLRGDGSPGGYRWGLKRKRALLDAERKRKTG